MTYERVRVGDVLKLEREPVQPQPVDEHVSIGVRSFGKGIFHYEPVLGGHLGKLRFFDVVPDRLVVSNIKGWEGAVAVSAQADAGCIASSRFLFYAPIGEQVDVRWARWYFLSENGLDQIRRASPGSADRNRTLAIERFEALEIPLPPIDEQRRVAERLDRIRAASDALADRSRRCDELSRALAVSLASRPDLDDEAKSAAGWRQIRLDEVMTQVSDAVAVEPDKRYRTTGTYSFGRGLIDRGEIFGAETSYKAFTPLTSGDVVLSKLNGWEGAVAVVPPDFDGSFVSSEYPTFRIDLEQLVPGYFGAIASAPWFWERLNTAARGSMVRRRRINPAQFLDVEIWIPGLERQRDVAAQLTPLGRTAAQRQRLVTRIDALLPSALNEAFAGLS